MPENDKTKECPKCDAKVAKDAETCPACGVDFAELELTIKALDDAEIVRAKRKAAEKKNEPAPVPQPKRSVFGNLARKRVK